jgi:transglutaminase-like putative cysteine protease
MMLVSARVTDGLESKLADIRALILEGARDPDIGRLAQSILRQNGPALVSRADPRSVGEALFRWQKQHIAFAWDPGPGQTAEFPGASLAGPLDLIQNAGATLERMAGDCVAQAILMGSLCRAVGLPVQIGLQDTQGLGVDHVLLLVGMPAAAPQIWLPMDLTQEEPGQLRAAHGSVQVVPV